MLRLRVCSPLCYVSLLAGRPHLCQRQVQNKSVGLLVQRGGEKKLLSFFGCVMVFICYVPCAHSAA